MLLYNVTTIVDDQTASEWLNWMEETHIPQVMATGKFSSFNLLKVVDSPNEGQTFCAQFIAATEADYECYITDYAPDLRTDSANRFKDKAVSFRSLMKLISNS